MQSQHTVFISRLSQLRVTLNVENKNTSFIPVIQCSFVRTFFFLFVSLPSSLTRRRSRETFLLCLFFYHFVINLLYINICLTTDNMTISSEDMFASRLFATNHFPKLFTFYSSFRSLLLCRSFPDTRSFQLLATPASAESAGALWYFPQRRRVLLRIRNTANYTTINNNRQAPSRNFTSARGKFATNLLLFVKFIKLHKVPGNSSNLRAAHENCMPIQNFYSNQFYTFYTSLTLKLIN